MENVGQLRQSAPPENGKSYWMVFSNKGRLVKRGDHVSVVIGAFHATGWSSTRARSASIAPRDGRTASQRNQ